MKVLLDTNIILDVFLEREPFVEDARALFDGTSLSITKYHIGIVFDF